jgi:ABC-type transporter Mla subunit MlaD
VIGGHTGMFTCEVVNPPGRLQSGSVHDLTPQLRTRLSRMERGVGLFVALAALLLLAGFAYYLRHTAVRKGWFKQKVPYYIYVQDATGLKPGDPVRMMGFDIGHILTVTPMPTGEWFVTNHYNVFVQFDVIEPNFGYIWTDSKVKVNPSDFLGNRQLEVVKGQTGEVTVVERDGRVSELRSETVPDTFVPFTNDAKGVWLRVEESAAVAEKVDRLFEAVQSALPVFTNHLVRVLASSAETMSNLNLLALSARPIATNLAEISGSLREPNGSLGRWLFPSNFNDQLGTTLTAATNTLTGIDSNLLVVVEKLTVSLDNLANITSNLSHQVHVNSNVLSQISAAVVASDELVQGLKRHWFLRGAFKTKTNPPASTTR